jgi:hypothetical protein
MVMLGRVGLIPEDKEAVEVLSNRLILALSNSLEFMVRGVSAEVHAHIVFNIVKEVCQSLLWGMLNERLHDTKDGFLHLQEGVPDTRAVIRIQGLINLELAVNGVPPQAIFTMALPL